MALIQLAIGSSTFLLHNILVSLPFILEGCCVLDILCKHASTPRLFFQRLLQLQNLWCFCSEAILIEYESFIARAGSSVYVNNNLAAYTAGGGISLVQPLLQIVCTSSGLRMIGEKLIRKSSNRAFAPSNLLETIKFLLFYHYNKILHVCMVKNPILHG